MSSYLPRPLDSLWSRTPYLKLTGCSWEKEQQISKALFILSSLGSLSSLVCLAAWLDSLVRDGQHAESALLQGSELPVLDARLRVGVGEEGGCTSVAVLLGHHNTPSCQVLTC